MSGYSLIILMVLLFGWFYFLMVRPVRQRAKKHEQLMSGLNKGDLVITAGGIYGRVESMDEGSVILKVESGATIRVTKGAIVSHPEEHSG